MISYTIKFQGKNFQNRCNPGESCFKFQMKCLNCLDFVTAHAFLSFRIFHSCTILGEFGWHTVEDFFFHVLVFSRETFQTLAWKFLLCVTQKVFGVYIFPNFVTVQYIVVQKLFKAIPRRLNTSCLFLLFAGGI